jgi:hypothetical protein
MMQNLPSERKGSRAGSKVQNNTSRVETLQQGIMNPLFSEMKFRLGIYKTEQLKAVTENLPIMNETFKKNFYTSLENLLIQISLIKDPKLRDSKIETVHKWFKVKLTFFNDLNTITARTDRNVYENHPDVGNHVKSDFYLAENYPRNFEREHRTEDEGLMPPKDR